MHNLSISPNTIMKTTTISCRITNPLSKKSQNPAYHDTFLACYGWLLRRYLFKSSLDILYQTKDKNQIITLNAPRELSLNDMIKIVQHTLTISHESHVTQTLCNFAINISSIPQNTLSNHSPHQTHITLNIQEEQQSYTLHISSDHTLLPQKSFTYFCEDLSWALQHYQDGENITYNDLPSIATSWKIAKGKVTSFKNNMSIINTLEKNATIYSHCIAIETSEEKVTYHDFFQGVTSYANALTSLGITKEFIILSLPRTPQAIMMMFAALKAGSAFVPVDKDTPNERLKKIIKRTRARIGFFADDTLEGSPLHTDYFTPLSLEKLTTISPQIKKRIQHMPKHTIPQDTLYSIFTSGTTGEPKGVQITQTGILNLVDWLNRSLHIEKNGKALHVTSFAFDMAYLEIFYFLFYGGSLFLTNDTQRKNPEILSDIIISQDNITSWTSAPALINLVLPHLAGYELKYNTIKNFILGGDFLTEETVRTIHTTFPNAHIFNVGGATETSIIANAHKVLKQEKHPIPYGLPMQNSSYLILNDQQELCPPYIKGEIYIQGICLASEYTNNPEITQKAFPIHPLYGKIYKTGDLGSYSKTNIYIHGRIDTQIKINNHRVETFEIIQKVKEMSQDFLDVIVICDKDDIKDTLYLAIHSATRQISPQEVIDYLKKYLAPYMIPSYVLFMKTLPLNTNGKIDTKFILHTIKNPFQKQDIIHQQSKHPIASAWEYVLKKSIPDYAENFFNVGGSSLDVLRLYACLNNNFHLSIHDFYIYPTLEEQIKNFKPILPKDKQLKQLDYLKKLPTKINLPHIKENKFPFIQNLWMTQDIPHKNIVITGVTGNLGFQLLAQALRMTSGHITCITRKKWKNKITPLLKKYFPHAQDLKRISIIYADLSILDKDIPPHIYQNLVNNTDIVIHAAAKTKHWGKLKNYTRHNITATQKMIDLCEQAHAELHFISTISIYRDVQMHTPNLLEEIHYIPNTKKEISNLYTHSKAEAEHLIAQHALINPHFKYTIIRVGNICAPFFKTSKHYYNNTPNAFRKTITLLDHYNIVMNENLTCIDLTYRDILARHIFAIIKHAGNKKIWHLCNKTPHTYKTLMQTLKPEIQVLSPKMFASYAQTNDDLQTQTDMTHIIEYAYNENNLTHPIIVSTQHMDDLCARYKSSVWPDTKDFDITSLYHTP